MSDQKTQIFKRLGIQDPRIQDAFETLNIDAGQILFRPGDKARMFLIVLSGRIRVDLITKSDREVTLYHVGVNETCLLTNTALLQSDLYYALGTAERDVEALGLPAQDFARAIEMSPAFLKFVIRDYSNRIENLVGLVDRLATKDISGELVKLLCQNTNENGRVPFTQSHLAREIGTAREVIARKLAVLEKQGHIRRVRGGVILQNRATFCAEWD